MANDPLTGARRARLRGLAQTLEPALKVGREGLTPPLLAELERLLTAHELVKLRFVGFEREDRAALCERIATEARCTCVGAVGHTAAFYREHPEPPARRITF